MVRKKIESVVCSICTYRASGHRGSPSIRSECETCSTNPHFENRFEPDIKYLSEIAKRKLYPRE